MIASCMRGVFASHLARNGLRRASQRSNQLGLEPSEFAQSKALFLTQFFIPDFTTVARTCFITLRR